MTAPERRERYLTARSSDELLTVADVSAMTTLAQGTLSSWRALGRGPQSFRLGGRVVYRRSVVEEWIAAQEQNSARGEAS